MAKGKDLDNFISISIDYGVWLKFEGRKNVKLPETVRDDAGIKGMYIIGGEEDIIRWKAEDFKFKKSTLEISIDDSGRQLEVVERSRVEESLGSTVDTTIIFTNDYNEYEERDYDMCQEYHTPPRDSVSSSAPSIGSSSSSSSSSTFAEATPSLSSLTSTSDGEINEVLPLGVADNSLPES